MPLEEWKSVVATSATVCTIVQFLSGTLICQRFVQKGGTGDISGLPFVCGLLSCSLWLRYGFLVHEPSLTLVNTVGATLHLAYTVTFMAYSSRKGATVRQLGAAVLLLAVAVLYTLREPDESVSRRRIGMLCCVVTVAFFASPLATLAHVVRTKCSDTLPFPLILSTLIVSLQWYLYGLLIHDWFVQLPNFLGCVLSALQLCLFLCYPRTPRSPATYTTLPSHDL